MFAIAIVGMACEYPDARSPDELWENVLAQRRAFRRMPAERLDLRDYANDDPQIGLNGYAGQAAVLEPYEFDRLRFRVVGSTRRTVDIAHWLALDCADRALADAGFPDGQGLPHATTGVILGNTLTGDRTRALALQLRWPFVRHAAESALAAHGYTQADAATLVSTMREAFFAPFEPTNEETLAGSLANTIAGRIANHFNLQGGGYIVDGACAASLLSITNACGALLAGDVDVALAGGVDVSLDPFELVGFARVGALASHDMRVFDRRANGFWPGEGCGIVVLMRVEDAIAHGRRIHAVIRGWGLSSDGHGGMTRPEVGGQRLALARAYRRAGFDIASIRYFEAHGTGTPVGDDVELRALESTRRDAGARPGTAAIGSIKANIGHTKAAAGVAALIKAVMAIDRQVLPPATACDDPHPILEDAGCSLTVLHTPRRWPHDAPLRAAASAMGFGGINTHVIVEGLGARRVPRLSVAERAFAATPQGAELLVWAAESPAALLSRVVEARDRLPICSESELTDFAVRLQRECAAGSVRAAIVASTPAEAAAKCATLAARISAMDEVTTQECERCGLIDCESGIYVGIAREAYRIGLLFPGHGVAGSHDAGVWGRRFEAVAALYHATALPDGDVRETTVAQPSIVLATLAGLTALASCGIAGTVAVGHSLGELSALAWAGALDYDALMTVVRARAAAMHAEAERGEMAVLRASPAIVEEIAVAAGATVAAINGATQTAIAGSSDALDRALAMASAAGIAAHRLTVPYAFHSPAMQAAADRFARDLEAVALGPLLNPVCSTVRGRELTVDDDLRALLVDQCTQPVRFTDALRAAGAVDLWIEVGRGRMLTGLAREEVDCPVIALDVGGPTVAGWLHAVATTFVLGVPVRIDSVADGRFSRPIDITRERRFLRHPCEAVARPVWNGPDPNDPTDPADPNDTNDTSDASSLNDPRESQVADQVADHVADPVALACRLVSARAELPIESVHADQRLLRDLHFNSLSVGVLASDLAHALGRVALSTPTELANATIRELVEAVRLAPVVSSRDATDAAPGIAAWVRPFAIAWEPWPIPDSGRRRDRREVRAEGLRSTPVHDAAVRAIVRAGGGDLIIVPDAATMRDIGHLFESLLRVARDAAPSLIVILHRDAPCGALARTLALEAPHHDVLLVDVAADHPDPEEALYAEMIAVHGFMDVRLTANARLEPRLELVELENGSETESTYPVGRDDVVLVTGGAAGITAECALVLARETGARLALLGRTAEDDPAIVAWRDRCEHAGVATRYEVVDLLDAARVRTVVQAIQDTFGSIAGVLHGAAVNDPCTLAELSAGLFDRTVETKVLAARHLLDALDDHPLKLFVAFGSVIARSGLIGEAHYGAANEQLARLIETARDRKPETRWLTIEWSVWAGAGMGERLGRVAALAHEGVSAITLDQGTAAFLDLLRARAVPSTIVVASRLRASRTLAFHARALPTRRFLDRVRVLVPGVEIVADTELTLPTDPYLQDHTIESAQVLPGVMGLEAMAQAATALLATAPRPTSSLVADAIELTDIAFDAPIVVPLDGRVTVRVLGMREADGCVSLAVRASTSGFTRDHMRARLSSGTARASICERAQSREPRHDERVAHAASAAADDPALRAAPFVSDRALSDSMVSHPGDRADAAIDASSLYGPLFFHGPRFQAVRRYRRLHATEAIADIAGDVAPWFAAYLPQSLELGDPGLRDACIHAIQACIPHSRIVPVAARRLWIRTPVSTGPLVVSACERSHEGDVFTYDLTIRDRNGDVCEIWHGLELRVAGPLMPTHGWPPAVLAPLVERLLARDRLTLVLAAARDAARSASGLLERLTGDRVTHRPDGRPDTNGSRASIAYAPGFVLAAAAPQPIGCDLELVVERSRESWRHLLGPDRDALVTALETMEESVSARALRVWSAAEALRKSGLPFDAPLTIAHTNGVRVDFRSGDWEASSLRLSVAPDGRDMILTIATHAREMLSSHS